MAVKSTEGAGASTTAGNHDGDGHSNSNSTRVLIVWRTARMLID